MLGVIPARGGSKTVPRKNLADVGGKPLLAWTIECAQQCECFDWCICTSDDAEILSIADGCGMATYGRPPELASDTATTHSVVAYLLDQYSSCKWDAVMVLQPTCPLRTPADIDGAIALMESTHCDSVVSYTAVGPNHPARMATIPGDESGGWPCPLEGNWGQFSRVQDLPPVYIRSGDIYLSTVETVQAGSLVGDDCRAWIIPEERHLNIDTPRDLLLARAILGERI